MLKGSEEQVSRGWILHGGPMERLMLEVRIGRWERNAMDRMERRVVGSVVELPVHS